MANERHLAKLREGREAWNAWREEQETSFRPNLTHADLEDANLLGYDLSDADLANASLRRADLFDANLALADLNGADLSSADLRLATLYLTTVDHADWTACLLGNTVLADVSLRTVRGLETIRHDGPSSLGIDTFFLSPNLPEAFLRGCGVPDEFITYAASLTAKPIKYYSCFLSYSSKDSEFAQRLYADLQAKNIRTWFAPEDLKIGDPLKPTIDQSIRVHDKLLLVVSEHSIRSAWVEREVEAAMRQEQKQQRTVLFPVRLDDGIFGVQDGWATDLTQRHIGDFREWKSHDSYTRAFDRLVRDLKKLP